MPSLWHVVLTKFKSPKKNSKTGKANTGLLKKIEVGSYEIFQTAVKNPSYTLLTYTGG